MVVPLDILLPVLTVLLRFMGLKIRRVRLPGTDVTAVTFILNHAIDRARIPHFITQFRRSSIAGKQVSYLSTRPAVYVQIIDNLDRLCFVGIDYEISLFVDIVSEEFRSQEDSLGETALYGPAQNKGFRSGFLLRHSSEDSKDKSACGIKRIQIVFVKMDADAQFLQIINDRQAVYNISGETDDGLSQNVIYFVRLFYTM